MVVVLEARIVHIEVAAERRGIAHVDAAVVVHVQVDEDACSAY